MVTKAVELKDIRLDGGTQPRAAIDEQVVDDYCGRMKTGDKFPPADVFYDGTTYWLADGFHRYRAAEAAANQALECTVHQGTQQDAQWWSYGANRLHGLRRSNDDKRRAVEAALRHPGAHNLSNRQIAEHVGVDEKTVRTRRLELESTAELPQSDVRTGRDGRPTNTAKIGKSEAASDTVMPVDDGVAGQSIAAAEVVNAPAKPANPARPDSQMEPTAADAQFAGHGGTSELSAKTSPEQPAANLAHAYTPLEMVKLGMDGLVTVGANLLPHLEALPAPTRAGLSATARQLVQIAQAMVILTGDDGARLRHRSFPGQRAKKDRHPEATTMPAVSVEPVLAAEITPLEGTAKGGGNAADTAVGAAAVTSTQLSAEGVKKLKAASSQFKATDRHTDPGAQGPPAINPTTNDTAAAPRLSHEQAVVEIKRHGGTVFTEDTPPIGPGVGVTFQGTKVADAAMGDLKWLEHVRTVYLNNTNVTDAGLVEHLKGLMELKQVNVTGTKITAEGAKKLKQALPECDIIPWPILTEAT